MKHLLFAVIFLVSSHSSYLDGQATDQPYITTQTPITLFSTQDGETEINSFSDVEPYDYKLLSEDSFTVIHLGPDHPPIVKTVYGTIPATILGTPSMAMSSDGRYGLVSNHSWRDEGSYFDRLTYKKGAPVRNSDLTPEMLDRQHLSPQLSDMISVVDLHDPEHPVTDRILLDDQVTHILAHPDGDRFFAMGRRFFFTYRLDGDQLIELARSETPYGVGCFWIHPDGTHILAARNKDWGNDVAIPQWYAIDGDHVIYINDLEIDPSVDTEYANTGVILRITPDGKRGFICQKTMYSGLGFADVLIADLTLEQPKVTGVIKQVGDGLESFAFHPNGKMAVATVLEKSKNSLAVLDIESSPPRLLYHLDAASLSQGVEFTPEGDKLFLGSTYHGRIEIYDVVDDFELVKNQKFIKIGYGHNSLSIGPRYTQN